jgi:hypothetical protein
LQQAKSQRLKLKNQEEKPKPAAVIKTPQKKITALKEEKPVTMEWDFKTDVKIKSERAKVLMEQE